MFFTHPPVIHNTGSRKGVYVQGSFLGMGRVERESFEDIFNNMQFVVQEGERLTGAQWISAIENYLGPKVVVMDSTQTFLEVLRKAMLVDKFKDDFVLFNPKGLPLYRGPRGQCVDMQYSLADLETDDLSGWRLTAVGEISPAEMDQVSLTMAKIHALDNGLGILADAKYRQKTTDVSFDQHFYNITAGFRLFVSKDPAGSPIESDKRVQIRALSLIQNQSNDAVSDTQAIMYTMKMLVNNFGYNTFAIVDNSGPTLQKFGEPAFQVKSEEEMGKLFLAFLKNNRKPDILTNCRLYICRPSALFNAVGACSHFEMIVNADLIGWKIPHAFVQAIFSR